jgi:hypothetical protein
MVPCELIAEKSPAFQDFPRLWHSVITVTQVPSHGAIWRQLKAP